MVNRVVVKIDGFEYTVVAEESIEHIKQSAALVDQSIKEIKGQTNLAPMTAAVLAAMNISDKYYKAQESGDSLRMQVKEYAEECSKLRSELARLRRA